MKEITFEDIATMARTIYGEARGEGREGLYAVGFVIYNRFRRPSWWGTTISNVCQMPYQFSCWNKNDPNRQALLSARLEPGSVLWDCVRVAVDILSGNSKDNTDGATHYFNYNLVRPAWAATMTHTVRIGNHDFYRSEE